MSSEEFAPDPIACLPKVDYIFASRTLASRLSACEVGRGAWDQEASHHFPVWAEFS